LGGLFEAGTAYTATVTLTAVSGYSLSGVEANAFDHTGKSGISNSAGSGVVVISFPATSGVAAITVSDRDLTYKLSAPMRGGAPVTSVYSPQYTGTVDWLAGGNPAPHDVFQGNMAYTAKVTLSAAAGHTFGNPMVNFTHNGAASPPAAADNGNGTITLTVPFPATTTAAALTVSDLNLSAKIPTPMRNGTPVTYFSAPQYTGNVAWSGGGTPLGGIFGASTAHTAKVTLTAASGWTFSGVGEDAFTHSGAAAGTPANDADSGVVTVAFPSTTSVAAQMVNERNLTGMISAPVRGGTPVTYFSVPLQYTAEVAWTVSSGGQALGGLFEGGTAYTATVTLAAASGYTFNGIPANAFTHFGASGTPVNAANTGVVTITFPPTTTVAAVVVNDRDLTYKLPAPMRGGTPVSSVSSPQYTGQVDWLVGGTSAPHDVFQAGMAYTAKVTLTAVSGYTFGNPVAVFTHGGAAASPTSADNGGGTVTVTVPFPATTTVAAVTVSNLNLTAKVPAPVWGGTPETYVSTPQYTGTVAWSTGGLTLSGRLFGESTIYKTTVTLTVASGYTFTGVTADSMG
jgi:hypothetical protein